MEDEIAVGLIITGIIIVALVILSFVDPHVFHITPEYVCVNQVYISMYCGNNTFVKETYFSTNIFACGGQTFSVPFEFTYNGSDPIVLTEVQVEPPFKLVSVYPPLPTIIYNGKVTLNVEVKAPYESYTGPVEIVVHVEEAESVNNTQTATTVTTTSTTTTTTSIETTTLTNTKTVTSINSASNPIVSYILLIALIFVIVLIAIIMLRK